MTKLTGSCLCEKVTFKGDADIKAIINCHCDDCQKVTGSVHGTLMIVPQSDIEMVGEPSTFEHVADSGNQLTKIFCSSCGSQVAGLNTGRPGMMTLRAGSIDQKELVKPAMNIYCNSAIETTPMDSELKTFPKMPG
ncbi:MAG: GFA family protein [Pseudomonadota bacterium]